MRGSIGAAAACLVLALTAARGTAQGLGTPVLPGVSGATLVQQPIDLSKAVIAAPAQTATVGNRFNFSALFSKFPVPTWPITRGVSNLPAPSQIPGWNYASPIQPRLPIIPNTRTPVGPGSN